MSSRVQPDNDSFSSEEIELFVASPSIFPSRNARVTEGNMQEGERQSKAHVIYHQTGRVLARPAPPIPSRVTARHLSACGQGEALYE